jgi:aminopeptidase
LGEFAIGANYGIKKFMYNTLFDEKIGGTIHTALGKSYEDKQGWGRNKSAIHWDIVKDTRRKGSEVWIDNTLVVKSGKILV